MITRIVKMTFRDDQQVAFENIFRRTRTGIENFKGCIHVELLKDATNPSIYFTISHWESETCLENYRASDFFKATWAAVKPMFSDRAQAWTLNALNNI